MVQAVSLQRLIAEIRVRLQASPYGILDGQSDTGTGFSRSTSLYLSHYHSILPP
jgi:hypothetical protein